MLDGLYKQVCEWLAQLIEWIHLVPGGAIELPEGLSTRPSHRASAHSRR